MSDNLNQIVAASVKPQRQFSDLIGKLFNVAQPGQVFSEPVTSGEHTIITASEAYVAMGAAYGTGGGNEPQETPPSSESASQAQTDTTETFGGGTGGGGGGVSVGRPVAVISVGPDGVRIEPVVDVTKIALAFFTMLGSMLIMLGRMRRASRG